MANVSFRRAKAVGDALVEHGPVAVSACYDTQSRQVAILLRDAHGSSPFESIEAALGAARPGLGAVYDAEFQGNCILDCGQGIVQRWRGPAGRTGNDC